MKIQPLDSIAVPGSRRSFGRTAVKFLCALAAAISPLAARAATAVYTNAPANVFWTNGVNWVEGAYPGALNMTGNTVNGDIAIFTNPIAGSGIGGAANPILVGDATIAGDRSLQVSGLTFDGTNCGAYVISGTTPPTYPGTGIPEVGILNVSHNGAIRMNAPVTNIETIVCPVLTRLPSSTQGVFNFINNAVNPSGVFVIYSITNDSANTRGTTFVLDGTNTGTNTIYAISQNSLDANGSTWITKQGTGTWFLTGANIFLAKSPHLADSGLLVLQNPGALGAANAITVTSNAVVRVDAVSITNIFTLQLTGTVRENGISTISQVAVSNGAGTAPVLATTSPSDVMTVGVAANAVSGGSSSSILHITGPGTVLLSQADNYTGNWSVDSGTNQLGNATALGTGPNVNIAAGAVLDTTPLTVGGGTYALTTAGLSAKGTGTVVGSTAATINADPSGVIDFSTGGKMLTLTITPTSFTSDTTHPALYVANGTLKSGNNSIAVVNNGGTPLGTGTYTLIQQASGSITDVGNYSVTGVSGSGLAAGDVASIVVSGGSLNLVVAPYVPKNLLWSGSAANENWDVNADANFYNGAVHSVFNNSDNATFNSVGASNPVVTLVGTLAPSTLVVDTAATNYTFTGNGSVAGATSLVKVSPGTLLVLTTNSYAGGTVVSNGVLQLGAANVIPDAGNGDVTDYGTIDLNGNSDTINGLSGTGVIDTVAGGAPVLTIGNNNDGGTFSGTIQNTAGTLGITYGGSGTETFSGNNTYSGPTVVNNGTIRADSLTALGASAVTVNLGTLDLESTLLANSLAGSGNVANNSSAVVSELIISNSSTFNGLIVDGTGGGGVSVLLAAGSATRLNGNNTYSQGTYLALGSTLDIGSSPSQAGTGTIYASNNTTIALANTGSATPVLAANIDTVPGATCTFTSRSTANNFGDQFYGSATATNIFSGGNMSIGGVESFSNFFGTVIVNVGTMRMFNAVAGGDNTTFIFTNNGGMFSRDADQIHLGALFGDPFGRIDNPSVTPGATYLIGGKNIDSVYAGEISGSNNIVKIGTGALTLAGTLTPYVTSPDGGLTFVTNLVPSSTLLDYTGSTVVSNGTLRLIAPAVLTNIYLVNVPTPITLASATAIFDASQMGYISTDDATYTNVVTNGILEVVASQSLSGLGTIQATNALFDAGSLLNIGLPFGTLNATQKVELAGVVTANVDVTNTPNCGELVSPNITVDGTASLIITNLGPENGATFQLFNHAVSFPSVTLPPLTGTNSWVNNLAVNGSITLLAPPVVTVNTNSTNLTSSVVFNPSTLAYTLNLSWPADHTGWHLQIQTNSLANGLGTNWVTLLGSELVDSTNLPVNPQNASVFYRLTYP